MCEFTVKFAKILAFLIAGNVYLSCVCGESTSTLRAVALIFRHGDRSPLGTFPRDPHRNYSWPGGYGALSPKGVKQLYTAGVLRGKIYSKLFKNSEDMFDSSKIYLQSSSTQRCVDSAIGFLEGFIPTKWAPSLVHVLPALEDEMLVIWPGKVCPKYDITLNADLMPHDPEIEQLVGDEETFINFLVNNTGLNATAIRRFYYISDSFKVQLDNGLKLPSWAESIYESHLKPLGDIIFNKWGHTPRMQVRSGVLLKNIVDGLEDSTKGGRHNTLLYSGHDLTISSLMIRLGIIEQTVIQPDYGATLAFELHENEDLDGLELKMLYFRDYLDEDPIVISLLDCEEPCNFEMFKASMLSRFTTNYEEACRLK